MIQDCGRGIFAFIKPHSKHQHLSVCTLVPKPPKGSKVADMDKYKERLSLAGETTGFSFYNRASTVKYMHDEQAAHLAAANSLLVLIATMQHLYPNIDIDWLQVVDDAWSTDIEMVEDNG